MKKTLLLFLLTWFYTFSNAQEQQVAHYANSTYTLLYNFDSIANIVMNDVSNTQVVWDSQYVKRFGGDYGIVITGLANLVTKVSYTIITGKDSLNNLITKYDTYTSFYGYTSCEKQNDCCSDCFVTTERDCSCEKICSSGTCDKRTYGVMPAQGISNAIRDKVR